MRRKTKKKFKALIRQNNHHNSIFFHENRILKMSFSISDQIRLTIIQNWNKVLQVSFLSKLDINSRHENHNNHVFCPRSNALSSWLPLFWIQLWNYRKNNKLINSVKMYQCSFLFDVCPKVKKWLHHFRHPEHVIHKRKLIW